ncbi:Hypothetical_protein [Hexamita inflata]|uniref:Hypothetical_protein n=1 Tax=Hexamita inflata TaxID=28002 RepID=A0AA86PXI2_9EUKA|nr:Hypothetical protein HINF_LOCUS33218 [Hexamita inflata]
MQEHMKQMQELKKKKNEEKNSSKQLILLKQQYGYQKHRADDYQSQILNPYQIKELIHMQDNEIQQRDILIAQYQQELNILHYELLFKYREEQYFNDFLIMKQYDQLARLKISIMNQLLKLSQSKSENIQASQQELNTIISPKSYYNTIKFTEDQKMVALALLIRDGHSSYKQQLKMNDQLPSIRTLQYFRRQYENSKYSNQNELGNNKND